MARSIAPTFRIALTSVPGTALDRFSTLNVRIADLGIAVKANSFKSIEAAVQAAINLQAAYEAHIAECQSRKSADLPAIHVPTVYFHAIECAPGAKIDRRAGGASVKCADVTTRMATGCVVGTK